MDGGLAGFFGLAESSWVPVATHPVRLHTDRNAQSLMGDVLGAPVEGISAPLVVLFVSSRTIRYVPFRLGPAAAEDALPCTAPWMMTAAIDPTNATSVMPTSTNFLVDLSRLF